MNSARSICKYTLIGLLLMASAVYGQEVKDEHNDDFELPDSTYAVINAVKFDPVQIFFGDYRFYYERMLGLQSSVELGAGLTGRNYASGWFEDDLDTNGSNIDINTGYAFSAAFRRYFIESGELFGSYLALYVSFHRYDKTYTVQNDAGVTVPGYSFKDTRLYTSAMLQYGYQALPIGSNIFADLYVGFGVRYKDLEVVDTTDIHDPAAYTITPVFGLAPTAIAGVKIGFGW